MHYKYRTSGVCSRSVSFDLDESGVVTHVEYDGGCNGNSNGIARLVEGKKAQDIMNTLAGVRCGYKTTSCPDQLSKALAAALNGEGKA